MEPIESKSTNTNDDYEKKGLRSWLQWLMAGSGTTPTKNRRGFWGKSNAPKQQKERKPHVRKVRKPEPKGRAALVARQKKARPMPDKYKTAD